VLVVGLEGLDNKDKEEETIVKVANITQSFSEFFWTVIVNHFALSLWPVVIALRMEEFENLEAQATAMRRYKIIYWVVMSISVVTVAIIIIAQGFTRFENF